jgi:signal peptidase II
VRALLVAAAILVADQLTKGVVRARIPLGRSIPVVDGYISLTHVRNSGAAFGLMPDGRPILVAAGILMSLILMYVLIAGRVHHSTTRVAMGMVLGGSLGNLVERLGPTGRVTDFLDVHIWPVFNIADSAVVIGAIVLAVIVVFGVGMHPAGAGGGSGRVDGGSEEPRPTDAVGSAPEEG